MMKRVVLIAGVMSCGIMTPTFGQVYAGMPHGENLTFTITGEAKGKPDTMYVTLAADATAGNAADAFLQCKKKADAAAKAIEDLKIPNSEVLREMYKFSSPAGNIMYGLAQPSAVPSGTKVSQVLKVKIALDEELGMEELAGTVSRVLDVANKTGVGFTQVSPWQVQATGRTTVTPVTYVLEDATALRMKAVADGLSRAGEIKKGLAASGLKAGRLIGVAYAQTPQRQWPVFWPTAGADNQMSDRKSAVSSSPEELTVYSSMSYTYKVEQTEE